MFDYVELREDLAAQCAALELHADPADLMREQCRREAAGLCHELTYHFAWTGRADAADAMADRGLALVGDADDASKSRLLSAKSFARGNIGRLDTALHLTEQAMALAANLNDQSLVAEVSRDQLFVYAQAARASELVRKGETAVELQRSLEERWLPSGLQRGSAPPSKEICCIRPGPGKART